MVGKLGIENYVLFWYSKEVLFDNKIKKAISMVNKLDEQLHNVVLDSKSSFEIKCKKVKYLVRLGADVNSLSSKGEPILSGVDDIKMLELLIGLGADVNNKSDYGRTALFNAKNAEVAQYLIDKGGDVNIKDTVGDNALSLAIFYNRNDVLDVLINNGGDYTILDSTKKTLLFKSIIIGARGNFVERLIKAGVKLDVQDCFGNTALMYAIENRNEEAVIKLVEGGADVNVIGGFGHSALTIAIREGNEKIARYLVENGADVNSYKNIKKRNIRIYDVPLIEAIKYQMNDLAKYLVEKGADINANTGDCNVIAFAVKEENEEMVDFLLESGCDLSFTDRDGRRLWELPTTKDISENIILEYNMREFKKKTQRVIDKVGKVFKIFGGR